MKRASQKQLKKKGEHKMGKQAGETITVKIKDLKFDPELLDKRPVNQPTVNRYRRAMRFNEGVDDFPLMIVNKKTMAIVSGNHRCHAMLSEFGEEFEVDVIAREYENRREEIEHMVTENMKFGKQMEGFEAKRFRKWLYEYSTPVERIALLFNKSAKSVTKEIGGLVIITTGKKPKFPSLREQQERKVEIKKDDKTEPQEMEPVKGSMPKSVTQMTRPQWEEHKDKDIGVKVPLLAGQLIRHIKNDYIDPSYINVLRELSDVLNEYLKKIDLEKKE